MDQKTEMLHSLLISGVLRPKKGGKPGNPAPSIHSAKSPKNQLLSPPSALYSKKGDLKPKVCTLTGKYLRMGRTFLGHLGQVNRMRTLQLHQTPD